MTKHLGGALLVTLFLAIPATAGPTQSQVSFEAVVRNLGAPDPRLKIEALTLLAQAGYLEGAGPVAPLLADTSAEVQLAAMDTLLSLFLVDEPYTRKFGASIVGSTKASLPLLAFAQGPGSLVANPIPPAVHKGLADLLTSPVLEVRYNAAYAIGVFGGTAARRGTLAHGGVAVERLTTLAKDPSPLLRLAGTQALGRLYEQAWANAALNAEVMKLRVTAGDQVIAGMNDTDPYVKQASIRSSGTMRLERAVQSLIDLGQYYRTGGLAIESYEALARISHSGSVPALTAATGSRDERVRAAAIAGLARVADATTLSGLETRLAKDKSRHVALAFAFARARQGDLSQVVTIAEGFKRDDTAPAAFDSLLDLGPSIADALAPVAAHDDARVRAGVADVLGLVGNAQSVFVVQSLTRDGNRGVVEAALRSVKRLSPRPANAPRLM